MTYNFNTAPYYDDYDADNRFLKILFNPGRAVQARELTQIQSALQNQISSGAKHIFKDGANVLGGEVSINHRDWIQISGANTLLLNRVVYGETSLAVGIIEQLHDDPTNPIYYIRILSGTFADVENFHTYDTVCNGGYDTEGACLDNSWYDATLTYIGSNTSSISPTVPSSLPCIPTSLCSVIYSCLRDCIIIFVLNNNIRCILLCEPSIC